MNDLDRKKVPLVSQGQELSLLDVESSFLANGVPTHIMNHGNQELMRIQFVFSGGKIFQAKPLLASSVNDLLIGGTQRLSSNEIAKQIENTGAYLETSVNKDIAMLSLYCLTGKRYVGYIEKLMLLVREVLFDASFPEKELEVYRKIKQQEFLINSKKVGHVARNNFLRFLLGEKHAYAEQLNSQHFSELNREEIIDFHRNAYSIKNAEVFLSGKISDNVLKIFHSVFDSNEIPVQKIEVKEKLYLEIDSGANKEEFIEVENALQSAIMMGNEAIAKSHPDYVPLYVANAVLGGYFGSRLMNNIREEKGYSYGIGSYLISNKHLNYLLITTEVGVKHTASAVEEIKKEIERLQNELVGENELRRVKNYLKGKLLRMFDGVFPSMDRFLSARVLGIEYAFYSKLIRRIDEVSSSEINEVVKDYFHLDNVKTMIVGKN